MSDSTARKLALVTGASSGIGYAYAKRLAAKGYDIIAVGRRRDRLDALAASLPEVEVRSVVVDIGSTDGLAAIADFCANEPLTMLVNNAGLAHYMPFLDLPADKAGEVLHVKVMAPTVLARAAAPAMVARGSGTIVNVAGMIAFGAPSTGPHAAGRAVYGGTLAYLVALSQALHAELAPRGLQIQALCPGLVATEFHLRQGIDLTTMPRMSADDVVTASLRGLSSDEVVCVPGVEDVHLLDAVFAAELAAFHGQSPNLASRYGR